MSDNLVFSPSKDFAARAHIKSLEQYKRMYQRSIEDPEGFWGEIAGQFYWQKKWTKFREYDFKDQISIKYFIGAKTNIAYNALDRHLERRGEQTAILWEGNDPGQDGKLTYRQLHAEVCKFANVLKSFGVKKGDRVSIYMPMVPELAVAMLACARIGAVHPEEAEHGVGLFPLKAMVVGGNGNSLLILLGAVVLILLIAFTNIAGLFLVRA